MCDILALCTWWIPHRASLILFAFYIDNILDDKPEVKSSADKEEQPVDEIPKRIKKSDNTTQSKGKVGRFSNRKPKKIPKLFSYSEKRWHFHENWNVND